VREPVPQTSHIADELLFADNLTMIPWRMIARGCGSLLLAFAILLSSARAQPDSGAREAVTAPANPVSILETPLPGQLAVQLASARPAVRADYWIYAAALDQYAVAKEAKFKSHRVLWRFVERPRRIIKQEACDYVLHWGEAMQTRSSKEEADAIARFLENGWDGRSPYRGELRKDLESYAAELRTRGDAMIAARKPPAPAHVFEPPDLADLADGLLPSQATVEDWRDPSHLDFVLFAAALEQHALAKGDILKSEPILKSIVDEQLRSLRWAIDSRRGSPGQDADEAKKMKVLRDLLEKGYQGQFRPASEAVLGAGK
jgi:hypothetical protein